LVFVFVLLVGHGQAHAKNNVKQDKQCVFACERQDKGVNVVLLFCIFFSLSAEKKKKKNSRVQVGPNKKKTKIHVKTKGDVHLQLFAAEC
jgi:hypothetical protein